MTPMQRRRSLMGGSVKEKISFVPGTYSDGGYPTRVNKDGSMTAATWVCYLVEIPLTQKVDYKAGDILGLIQDRSFDSLSEFRSVQFRGSKQLTIVNNKRMNNYAQFTLTASEDGFIDRVYFSNATNLQAGTVKPQITLNGKIMVGG